MKRTCMFLFLSLFFVLSCTDNSFYEVKDAPTLNAIETKGIIWSDSVPPVIDPDPELGDNSCEKDRDWKLRDLIEDYHTHFQSPGSVTIHNVGGAAFKTGTPEWVYIRFRDTYNNILRDYDHCRENH